jgi:uncharacterized metal-binding protein (TIGR02443 family)|tara:strand:+ start:843 stop:1010 length:168 start_codon:yes stop_codon:yes gene_type:complete
MKDYKFIAGALCPQCGEIDSIVLKNDDSEIKCILCNYFKMKDHNQIESIKIVNDD